MRPQDTTHDDRQTGATSAPPFIPAIIPGLDGLRAVSILLVMLSHSGLSHVVPGVFGVTIFFFISGFLITTLMLAEHRAHGRIAAGPFYLRRLIRLYPPLIVSIAVTVAIYSALGERVNPIGIIGALAYLANYLSILLPHTMSFLGGQLWSLAVEEHFYFVYPLAMIVLLARPKWALPVLLAVCVNSLGVRIHVSGAYPLIAEDYTGKATECRIDSILYGAIAALMWWSTAGRAVLRRLLSPAGLALAGGLILVSLMYRDPQFRQTFRYSLQGLALIPLVVAVTVSGVLPWATAILDSAPMRWIGRLSYSLYLWHMLAFDLGERLIPGTGLNHLLAIGLGWVLAVGISMLCYRYVEQPFFALRKRFGSNVATTDHARG